jgi:uncharacterized protein YjbJ (UPF0337 family)
LLTPPVERSADKKIKGQIREEWGELTDDEIAQVEGTEERLVGITGLARRPRV